MLFIFVQFVTLFCVLAVYWLIVIPVLFKSNQSIPETPTARKCCTTMICYRSNNRKSRNIFGQLWGKYTPSSTWIPVDRPLQNPTYHDFLVLNRFSGYSTDPTNVGRWFQVNDESEILENSFYVHNFTTKSQIYWSWQNLFYVSHYYRMIVFISVYKSHGLWIGN